MLFLLAPLNVLIMESVKFHFPQDSFGLDAGSIFCIFSSSSPFKSQQVLFEGGGGVVSVEIKLQSSDQWLNLCSSMSKIIIPLVASLPILVLNLT